MLKVSIDEDWSSDWEGNELPVYSREVTGFFKKKYWVTRTIGEYEASLTDKLQIRKRDYESKCTNKHLWKVYDSLRGVVVV